MPHLERAAARAFCLLTLVALLASAGCGSGRPKTVPVAGRVTVNGKPLPGGDVQFIPEKGPAAAGKIDAEGRFQLTSFDENDGVPPGTYKVVVIATEEIGQQVRLLTPDRYGDPHTSDKTVTIDGPTDALAIDLTWGKEKPRTYQRPKGEKPVFWGEAAPK